MFYIFLFYLFEGRMTDRKEHKQSKIFQIAVMAEAGQGQSLKTGTPPETPTCVGGAQAFTSPSADSPDTLTGS